MIRSLIFAIAWSVSGVMRASSRRGRNPVEVVEPQRRSRRGAARRRPGDVLDDADGLAPDLLVAAVQERDRPVAAADEAVGPEGVDGDVDGVAQVALRPSRP